MDSYSYWMTPRKQGETAMPDARNYAAEIAIANAAQDWSKVDALIKEQQGLLGKPYPDMGTPAEPARDWAAEIATAVRQKDLALAAKLADQEKAATANLKGAPVEEKLALLAGVVCDLVAASAHYDATAKSETIAALKASFE